MLIPTKESLLKDVQRLPAIPDSVARLAGMISDKNTSAADFGEVISVDPSLTANLLKTANSAYFSRARNIGSVEQAVALLGLERVFAIATASAMDTVMPSDLPGYRMSAEQFWTHSIASAVLAEQLRKQIRTPNAGMLFTAALLHDIGQIIIGDYLLRTAPEYPDLIGVSGLPPDECEIACIGIEHGTAGALIAEAWSLPAQVVSAIHWHHHPHKAPDEHLTFVEVIHIAQATAIKHWDHPQSESGFELVYPAVLEKHAMSEEKLADIAHQVREEVDELKARVRASA